MYPRYPAIYTDFYELTMAQGYFLSGRHTLNSTFDYFFRNCPFNAGYVVLAGISDFLELLRDFRFSTEELDYLESQGFRRSFIDYLSDFRFRGDIYSVKEGEVVFPNEPLVRVQGNIIETQIIETLLLNFLNFESLIATKASRIRQVAGDNTVLDFGLRRSQGLGGIHASKAAVIGGFDGSSNVYSGMIYGLDVGGTMAHSWVQSFEDELTAFRTYAGFYPDDTVLLVDTYDTLNSGVPNAIRVAKELEKDGHTLKAIRLDSGDLAYFAKQSRRLLDDAGLEYVKIAASNQLDEHLIRSLIDQKAPIDVFGVGTKLVTAYDDPALNGVYKLSKIDNKPTLKISENVEKVTLPGAKKVVRYLNKNGSFYCDGIFLDHENNRLEIRHPYFPDKKTDVSSLESVDLLTQVVKNGELTISLPDTAASADYAAVQLKKLNPEHKRFDNPHVYKVGISNELAELRDKLVKGTN